MLKKLLRLCATGMALSLDFGMGVLIGAIFAKLFRIDLAWYQMAIPGILAFLPDFEVIPSFFGYKLPKNHHETLFHRPLLVACVTTIFMSLCGGTYWASVAFACVFWHYVHDTRGFGGGGIAWFWPLSRNYWSPRYGWETPEASSMATSGARHNQWLARWLYPSRLSLPELSLATVALGLGIVLLTNAPLGLGIFTVSWLGIAGIWKLATYQKPKQPTKKLVTI